jgi:hypothetical protein
VEFVSQFQEEGIAQVLLILKEQIVHLPELVVDPGKFGYFSSRLCPRMHLGQGEIAKDKREALSKVLLQPLDDWMGRSAVRAFIVAIFD